MDAEKGAAVAEAERRGVALVRAPGPRVAEGLVTHIGRVPVDAAEARRQHAGYREALAGAGWEVREAEPADECPDAVFIEDALVVVGGLAVVTRPGAVPRRAETAGAERAAAGLGLETARIPPPGRLDGGDVLQVGRTVYVGVGGRTDPEGVRALAGLVEPLGRRVVPVRLGGVLHLKSAVTALPDGTLLGLPGTFDAAAMPAFRPVEEEAGCHVVPLGGDEVLIGSSAPRTAAALAGEGWRVRAVDIAEFEKLEGCVTCLSVLVPERTG
ncbi:dimethylargininase [Nocardiopsis potens]|uniref:dimethylargininase n=1 Tax=Nocardiopsis potens TaxID=1246458 RepID=UPI00036B562E|nr:dimethylargininase [Nocardiopsis potens]